MKARAIISNGIGRAGARFIDRLKARALVELRAEVDDVFREAWQAWPVRSGRSRAALRQVVDVSGDEVTGQVVNDVGYADRITLKGSKTLVVDVLLRRPLRDRTRALLQRMRAGG